MTATASSTLAGRARRLGESTLKKKALALAAFLTLAVSALNALFGDRGFLSLAQTREQYQALVQEVEFLERENRRLEAAIQSYRQDPLVIERRAREVLGMAKPGEIAVSIRHLAPP